MASLAARRPSSNALCTYCVAREAAAADMPACALRSAAVSSSGDARASPCKPPKSRSSARLARIAAGVCGLGGRSHAARDAFDAVVASGSGVGAAFEDNAAFPAPSSRPSLKKEAKRCSFGISADSREDADMMSATVCTCGADSDQAQSTQQARRNRNHLAWP